MAGGRGRGSYEESPPQPRRGGDTSYEQSWGGDTSYEQSWGGDSSHEPRDYLSCNDPTYFGLAHGDFIWPNT